MVDNIYIKMKAAMDIANSHKADIIAEEISELPFIKIEEIIPHRNYQYLSDYWCECGWHLGKKYEFNYCPICGRKVNWNACE